MKTFKKGGIHPAAMKLSAGAPIVELPYPAQLRLLLSQSIGAPAKPVVKAGDHLEFGQLIAEPGGFVSAALHSPAAGTVKAIENIKDAQGRWAQAIIIDVDPGFKVPAEPEPLKVSEVEKMSPEELVEKIRNAGITGLGGAAFPTAVKLTPPPDAKAELIIINGAECEPYLTCDDALMRSKALQIIKGVRIIMQAVGVERAIIGIEENKHEAISAMLNATSSYHNIEVVELKKKYPQGGEKQLIEAITGIEVPDGALPVAVGCIVDNVATAYAIYQAVYQNIPLVRRVVTVTGPSFLRPGNILAPIGTPTSALADFIGGIPDDTGKLIAGGPMMGRAISEPEAPTVKGFSGLLALPESMSRRKEARECIRCGACVEGCPMGLEPYLLLLLQKYGRLDEFKAADAMSCIECGSCSWQCPSSRPLLDYIKLGKGELRKAAQKK